MEKHENAFRRFLPLLPRYEPIILDSSAISDWKKCQFLFFLKYVLAKVPKSEKINLIFGSAYHAFREGLSKGYFEWVRSPSCTRKLEDFPNHYLLRAIKDATTIFRAGGGAPPKGDRYDYLTEGRLVESCQVAYQDWLIERKQDTIEVVSTEFPFNFEYANGNRTSIRTDEIIVVNGSKYAVRDFKASSVNPDYYKKQLEPKDQAFRYILGVRKATGKRINDIWFQQLYNDKPTKTDSKGPLIKTHIISVTDSQLEEWEYAQQKVHRDINTARELDIYPKVDDGYTCTRGFGGAECAFRAVCLGNNANHIYSLLESNFKTRIWDNMEGETLVK